MKVSTGPVGQGDFNVRRRSVIVSVRSRSSGSSRKATICLMQANGPVAWVTMSARATITPREPRLAALRYAEWSVTFADQNPTEKSRSKAIYTGQHTYLFHGQLLCQMVRRSS